MILSGGVWRNRRNWAEQTASTLKPESDKEGSLLGYRTERYHKTSSSYISSGRSQQRRGLIRSSSMYVSLAASCAPE
jgi:hypothetical protein